MSSGSVSSGNESSGEQAAEHDETPVITEGEAPERGVADGPVSRNPERDPDQWVTGDQPMTGPQESYLHTLATEANVGVGEGAATGEVDPGLTKAEASKAIDALQDRTHRAS